jgi:hypothetical protein
MYYYISGQRIFLKKEEKKEIKLLNIKYGVL